MSKEYSCSLIGPGIRQKPDQGLFDQMFMAVGHV